MERRDLDKILQDLNAERSKPVLDWAIIYRYAIKLATLARTIITKTKGEA